MCFAPLPTLPHPTLPHPAPLYPPLSPSEVPASSLVVVSSQTLPCRPASSRQLSSSEAPAVVACTSPVGSSSGAAYGSPEGSWETFRRILFYVYVY